MQTIVFEALFMHRSDIRTLVNIMTSFKEFVAADELLMEAMISIEDQLRNPYKRRVITQ